MEEFGDFLRGRLNNTNIIMGDFNFHVEDIKYSKNLAFKDLLQSFGLIQHVGCPTYQSGHTLDLIITKEEDTLCVSDPVDKFYISDHSFVHSEIRINKPQVIRRAIRTRRMRNVEENEIKKKLEGIGEMIERESSIGKAVGMFNDRVKALFDRIFPEVEKRFDSEAKQFQIKCRKYERKWLKTKMEDKEAYLQIRRGYHNKLEFAKNYLNMKKEEFKGDGKGLFSLMYDIIGRVKENVLPDSGTSEQDLASKFCNFFVDKITNIRDRLKDNSRFVVQKEREQKC